MATDRKHIKDLIEKLEALPPERIAEVEDFIDFLKQRDRDLRLAHATAKIAEKSFAEVWDNPDDAVYDKF